MGRNEGKVFPIEKQKINKERKYTIMKKLTSVLIVLVLVVGALCAFAACDTPQDKDKPATVMNVALNPEVEFVLDGNGKVVSVNALNEDGNLIITATVFEGKTGEEAAKLFVEIAHEMGFLVSGNAGIENNDLSIQISGDTSDINKLYNDVKAEVESYFTEENIQAKVAEVEAIAREEIEKLVAQAQPYIEQAKLEALSNMELLEQLYESRKETCEMYSQELKNAYYNAKAAAMDTAKIQALKTQMGEKFDANLQKLFDTYAKALEDIEAKRIEYLVAPESTYQTKLAEFRAKKLEFLQKRQELAEMDSSSLEFTIKLTALNTLETAVQLAETMLIQAGNAANASLDLLKSAVTSGYNAIVSAIESAQVKIADHMDAIMQAQEEEVPKFAERRVCFEVLLAFKTLNCIFF